MDKKEWVESREYPSRLFFMDLLLKEVLKTGELGKPFDEVLDQLRTIWTAPSRPVLMAQIEHHLEANSTYRFPDDLQKPVADALYELVRNAADAKPWQRHSADMAVSKILGWVDAEHHMPIIEPWLDSVGTFRIRAILRSLGRQADRKPWAPYLVRQFREHGWLDTLQLISRTPDAAMLMFPEELDKFFASYSTSFQAGDAYPDKTAKYWAMIAAKVLVLGNQPIPPNLIRTVPEVFSWAIDEIGDSAYEPLLIWLIIEHEDNPQVLWSAIRTAYRNKMETALQRGIEAARRLFQIELGVMVLPISNDTD